MTGETPWRQEIGIYTERNRYGYWLNINHPDVHQAYRQYCREIGNPERYPLSDKQRRIFEIRYIQQRGIDHQTPEWVRYRYYEILERAQGGRL